MERKGWRKKSNRVQRERDTEIKWGGGGGGGVETEGERQTEREREGGRKTGRDRQTDWGNRHTDTQRHIDREQGGSGCYNHLYRTNRNEYNLFETGITRDSALSSQRKADTDKNQIPGKSW